jgi:hypothetical protein
MTQRLAIVERLPGHTEVMGGFASLALELGYDIHLLFNSKDQFHVVEYLARRMSIAADHIHDWSYINLADSQFDVILLNTSCVWLDYGFRLQQWNTGKRLIVVHHLPEDIELNPYGVSVYLTPAIDRNKWIFPMYCRPVEPAALGAAEASMGDAEELPILITIGALDLKDIAGVASYMKAGGKVVHYDRHKCRFFPDHEGAYTQHVGLGGTEFMSSLAQQEQPMFLWFPIVPQSHYMVYRFCGALIIGVDMNCVMVMPERLRKLYGFPEDAAITYDASITEAECLERLRASPTKQLERRRQLWKWAVDRWQENLAVFRTLLGSRT